MSRKDVLQVLDAAMAACASAEQQHGSKWTRAAWVAVVQARYVTMQSWPDEPADTE